MWTNCKMWNGVPQIYKIGMENKGLTNINDAAYQKLIDNITTLWGEAKSKAIACGQILCKVYK